MKPEYTNFKSKSRLDFDSKFVYSTLDLGLGGLDQNTHLHPYDETLNATLQKYETARFVFSKRFKATKLNIFLKTKRFIKRSSSKKTML